MWRRCAVMDPAVSSTSHSGHRIRLRSLTHYKSTTPVHFSTMAYSDIPALNAPGWYVIVRDLVTLPARPYLLKMPTRTFIACCSQSGSRDPTMPSSAYNTPRHRPTVSPSLSCATLWSSNVMASQVLMTLSTTTLNSVRDMSPPSVVPPCGGEGQSVEAVPFRQYLLTVPEGL